MSGAVPIIATAATVVLTAGVVAASAHGVIPNTYTHRVDGTVNVTVDVTVHTPDLADLKPGQLIPERITIVLPDGFTLRLPDTTQTVKVPTDYTVKNVP